MTSTTYPQKPKDSTTPKNSSTPKQCFYPKDINPFDLQFLHDDSATRTTRFYPYKFSLPDKQCMFGGICAGSEKGAKRIIQTLYPEAKKISVAKSLPYIFGKEKIRPLLK